MRKALIFNLCLFLTSILLAQNTDSSPQNTPGEINTSNSNNKTSKYATNESVESLLAITSKKEEIVLSLYFIEEETPKTYGAYASGGEIVTRQIKKRIYKAGQTLLSHHKLNLSNAKSEEEKIGHLKEIVRVNDRLIQLGQTDNTKAKEKELKKLKDIDTIQSVFFAE